MRRYSTTILISMLAGWLLSACALPLQLPQGTRDTPVSAPQVSPLDQVSPLVRIRGELEYTSDSLPSSDLWMILMLDLRGFVARDRSIALPVTDQIAAPLILNEDKTSGEFILHLPARPPGELVDLDHDDQHGSGVQIYNLLWWSNQAGTPYANGDDQVRGWAQYYTSTHHDSNSDGEIDGGQLIVWAPDGQQSFPTGYGADMLLFTADDPVAPIGAGYSVIDLEQEPFRIGRAPEERMLIREPDDYKTQDYSDDSYSLAFKRLADRVRVTYAFNGLAGKEPAWDTLIPEIMAQVQQAEQTHDSLAYYRALRNFTLAFQDGHVALDHPELDDQLFNEIVQGGYGFGARELDDGRFLVSYVLEDGPAEAAGLAIGDELLEINTQPIADAISAVIPYSAPYSNPIHLRYQQLRYLLRGPIGTETQFLIRSSNKRPRTITLTSIDERDSFEATSIYANLDGWFLPVEGWYLDDDIGNVLVASNNESPALTYELFERVLDIYADDPEVKGLVIDLRQNDGGQVLGLAGYFSDQPINLAQEWQRDTVSGEFETRGAPLVVQPRENQYSFDTITVLIGPGCASACEAEAYAFSQLPNAHIIGQYPTAGIFAAVISEEYVLPEGITMQFSKWRYMRSNQELFLEGAGVAPTLRVPVDQTTIFEDDPLRAAAIAAIRKTDP